MVIYKDKGFDLTAESIRRQYLGEESPLSNLLERYADFFLLFVDFHGYVEVFLLQDIVTEDFSEVTFFMHFDGLDKSPLPQAKEACVVHKKCAVNFIKARNRRIIES